MKIKTSCFIFSVYANQNLLRKICPFFDLGAPAVRNHNRPSPPLSLSPQSFSLPSCIARHSLCATGPAISRDGACTSYNYNSIGRNQSCSLEKVIANFCP